MCSTFFLVGRAALLSVAVLAFLLAFVAVRLWLVAHGSLTEAKRLTIQLRYKVSASYASELLLNGLSLFRLVPEEEHALCELLFGVLAENIGSRV